MVKKSTTWQGYIEYFSQKATSYDCPTIEGFENMLLFNSNFNSLFYHTVAMVYLLNYATGEYLLMSKSSQVMLGHKCESFTQNGIGFTIDLYHKEDLKLYDEKIFPERLKLIKEIPREQQPNYVFSFNFRLKNSQGDYVNLLQRNCFVKSDENGLPLLSMGMVMNIDHYKKENPVIQVIDKIDMNHNTSETVFKKAYYLNEENQVFSRREKEVLLWVADGLSSKEIANKLFISEGTVINHRKNMLMKSGCRNVAELMSFSVKNSIL